MEALMGNSVTSRYQQFRVIDEDNQSDVWDDSALIEAYDKAVSHVKEQIAKRNKVGSESDGKSSRNSSHKGKKRGRSKLKRTQWKVGDYCQATYSEDGRSYEAVITHIKDGMCTVKFVGYDNEENIHLNDIQHSHGKQARMQQSLAAQAYKNNVEQLETEAHWNHYADDTSSSTGVDPKQRLFPAHHENVKKHIPSPHAPWHNFGRPFPQHFFPGQPHHVHVPSCTNLPPASTLPCHHRTSTSPRIPPIPPPPFPIEDGLVDDDEALASMLMSWYMSGYHTGYYQGLRQIQTHHCSSSKLSKSCPCSH